MMASITENEVFVEVILPFQLSQLFTYRVPQDMVFYAALGKRVIVQFGAKKYYTGLIRRITQTCPPNIEIKNITEILDEQPIVNELHFTFWEWIASYYFCSIGEVFKAALPAGMKLESETAITINHNSVYSGDLNEKENKIIDKLSNVETLTLNEVSAVLEQKSTIKIIQSLINKDIIHINESIKERYKPVKEPYIKLTDSMYDEKQLLQTINQLAKAPRQLQLLMSYLQQSNHYNPDAIAEVKKKDLLNSLNASVSALHSLTAKNIFEIYFKDSSRLLPQKKLFDQPAPLSNEQTTSYQEIVTQFEHKNVVLFHGVTASGKTEIYIHLINDCIAKGLQVLYLLPEIAITTQIINRLSAVFGEKTGIYHSKFSDAERVEIWSNIAGIKIGESVEQYEVILGVRSSIFLPFKQLGLIIIDEEHENTYKQFDPNPRYHARDAAIMLAHLHGAKVLLGTATPAIESYFNAKSGKYGFVELLNRYHDVQLPEIMVADMKLAMKKKQMVGHFTPQLIECMQQAFVEKQQVILFQNRRGYSPYIVCESCGWTAKCTSCDVSLTYHKHSESLVCHYCGYTVTHIAKCGNCKSPKIKMQGFGTEKIEDELTSIFPDIRIARMDLDSMRAKQAYYKLINDFENHNVDVLVGTQMVSKGLDFDNVGVVGIMSADHLLNYPDFRAYERSYQLMSQVSGRAGRKGKRGKVIIQTFTPENYIIHDVIHSNYIHVFQTQVLERQQFNYPPFSRLLAIILKHKQQDVLNEAADAFAVELRKIFEHRVLGPEFPVINMIQTLFLKNILLKIEKEKPIEKAKRLLKKIADKIKQKYTTLIIVVDVDPQ